MDQQTPPPHKLTVLVVEDHFINMELMKEMLDRLNCTVDTAENGIDALGHISRQNYDIIFMDLQMPEMDGFQTTKEIRNMQKGKRETPIIAITANAMQSDKQKCLDAGMDDYLAKPFEIQDIEKLLKKYLSLQNPE